MVNSKPRVVFIREWLRSCLFLESVKRIPSDWVFAGPLVFGLVVAILYEIVK